MKKNIVFIVLFLALLGIQACSAPVPEDTELFGVSYEELLELEYISPVVQAMIKEHYNFVKFEDLDPIVQAYIRKDIESRGEKFKAVLHNKENIHFLKVIVVNCEDVGSIYFYEEDAILKEFGEK